MVTLLEWWNGLSENQVALAVPFIAAVLMAAGYLAKRWFEKPSPPANPTTNTASDRSIIQHTDGGTTVVYAGDVIIGLPQAEYEKRLKQREDEITAHLKEGHANERILLERELDAVQQRLQDIKASYQEHIKDLRERIAQLESLRGQVSDTLLSEAEAALARDDTKQADDLFRKVEEQTASAVKVAAEAAYQRYRIAYAAIQYRPALRHCQRAVQLAPENLVYLSSAGELAHILAQHRLAIGYLEQALASDLKTYGEAHPRVAIYCNNLGEAWRALGEYQKAIGYYEQALASNLKTYGEDHPRVATGRSNLGLAWHDFGEHEKAIGYYEQALASDLKTYREDHPHVAILRNNLGGAWQSLGNYRKAIDYLEQALASNLKTYGEDHPRVATGRNNLGGAWKDLGEYDKSIGYLEQAYNALRSSLGENHPWTKGAFYNLSAAKVTLTDSHPDGG